jgi:hypothetical protein
MDNKKSWILVVLAAVFVLLNVYAVVRSSDSPAPLVGAIGTNPVENYIPIIKYNDGYYSLLDITTTGNFSSAAGAFSGNVTIGGTLGVTGATTLSSTLGVTATTSLSSNLVLGATSTPGNVVGSGNVVSQNPLSTSTLKLYSTFGTRGGCVEFEGPASTTLRLYATTTGPAVFESGTCQ